MLVIDQLLWHYRPWYKHVIYLNSQSSADLTAPLDSDPASQCLRLPHDSELLSNCFVVERVIFSQEFLKMIISILFDLGKGSLPYLVGGVSQRRRILVEDVTLAAIQ